LFLAFLFLKFHTPTNKFLAVVFEIRKRATNTNV